MVLNGTNDKVYDTTSTISTIQAVSARSIEVSCHSLLLPPYSFNGNERHCEARVAFRFSPATADFINLRDHQRLKEEDSAHGSGNRRTNNSSRQLDFD